VTAVAEHVLEELNTISRTEVVDLNSSDAAIILLSLTFLIICSGAKLNKECKKKNFVEAF
jgi:hypothetical protein